MKSRVVDRALFATMTAEQQQYFTAQGIVLLSEIVSPLQMERIEAEAGGESVTIGSSAGRHRRS